MTIISADFRPSKMSGEYIQSIESFLSSLLGSCKAIFAGKRRQTRGQVDRVENVHQDKHQPSHQVKSPSKLVRQRSSSEQICEAEDADYWWLSTTPMLRTLMQYAEYSDERFDEAIKAYDEYVVGSLGPRPSSAQPARWKSFMTDDFTPIEMSWNWGCARESVDPTIRFSIEPVGLQSGTASDPWNKKPTKILLNRLEQSLPTIDTSIFRQLEGPLDDITNSPPVPCDSPQSASPSAMFLAFELQKHELMVKSYMQPFRSISTSDRSCGQMTVDFLLPFAHEAKWQSLVDLLTFLGNEQQNLNIHPFMIAFDCVPLPQTRMKIYVRSSETSFRAVRKVMSLFQDVEVIAQGLKDLEELWKLVFDLDSDFDIAAPLKHRDHETSGILYYLEVRPGSPQVTLKVYLPIKHYASSDLSAAQGLVTFMQQMRGSQNKTAVNYLSALKAACTHRNLEDGIGMQTYLSCAIKKGKLDITSYLNPETNHPARLPTGL